MAAFLVSLRATELIPSPGLFESRKSQFLLQKEDWRGRRHQPQDV